MGRPSIAESWGKRAPVAAALLFAAVAGAGCATEYTAAKNAIAEGAALNALGLAESDVAVQAQCWFAVGEGAYWCVYVQTADRLNFLAYNDETKTYEPSLSIPVAEISSASLQKFGFDRDEVQLRWQGKLVVFETSARGVTDAGIYDNLVAGGVASAEPEPWVELLQIDPQPITIYVPG